MTTDSPGAWGAGEAYGRATPSRTAAPPMDHAGSLLLPAPGTATMLFAGKLPRGDRVPFAGPADRFGELVLEFAGRDRRLGDPGHLGPLAHEQERRQAVDLHLDADSAGLRCLELHHGQFGPFCGDALDVRHEGEAGPAVRPPHVNEYEPLRDEGAERLTGGFSNSFQGFLHSVS